MVGRNQKGQILIESLFLMVTFVTLLLILRDSIAYHKVGIQKYKLSKEISRGYQSEN